MFVMINMWITSGGYRIAKKTAVVHIRFVFSDGAVVDTVINPYVTIERCVIISFVSPISTNNVLKSI